MAVLRVFLHLTPIDLEYCSLSLQMKFWIMKAKRLELGLLRIGFKVSRASSWSNTFCYMPMMKTQKQVITALDFRFYLSFQQFLYIILQSELMLTAASSGGVEMTMDSIKVKVSSLKQEGLGNSSIFFSKIFLLFSIFLRPHFCKVPNSAFETCSWHFSSRLKMTLIQFSSNLSSLTRYTNTSYPLVMTYGWLSALQISSNRLFLWMKASMASGLILDEKQVLLLQISLSSFTAYSFFCETWLDIKRVMTRVYKAHCSYSELLLSLSTQRSAIFFRAQMMPSTQTLLTRFSVSFCSNTLHTFSVIIWVRWRRQKVKSGGLMQSSSLSSSRMAEGCSFSKSFSRKSSKNSLQTSQTAWLKSVEMPYLLTILKGLLRQSTTRSLSWLQQVLESLWLRWSLTSLMASGPWQAMTSGGELSGKLGPQGSAMTWLLSIILIFSSSILLSPPACLASNFRSALMSAFSRPSTVRLPVSLNSRQRKAITRCISSSKLLCLASSPRCSSILLQFLCRNSLSLIAARKSMKRSTSTLLRLSASTVQNVGAPSSFIRIYIYTNLILAEVCGEIYNFNMDYFLIFRFEVLEGAENAGRLESLEAELVRQEEEKYGGSGKMQFTNLTFATNFRQAILAILKKIQDINNNFVNIQLVCEDTSLFTHILPAEFSARSLAMPYCLTNFVDWRAVCREKYGCVSRTLQETAKFLNLMELSDADVILKLLLKKLREQKAIVDTEVAFARRFESKQVAGENFAYFRCIGLPFQISKNELVQRMVEPQRYNIKNYGVSLIFEHGKFSGKAVLKVPAEFTEMVLRKDRMYIGRRYVQISTISRQDFEGYKMREQKQRQESRGREVRAERSSSSSRSRSRSRQKLEIHSLLNEAAVKVRGLPYSLNSWDIEQIFKRFNFVRGSIKLGFLGQRKSGEAVILFPNREEAERAMHLQGFVVQNRYLELKVISKQNYDRFK